jgi:predicted adenylyl cyclase CyaB
VGSTTASNRAATINWSSHGSRPLARNVEIKARIPDPDWDAVRGRAEALAAGPAQVLRQVDTFFNTTRGRLKLRVFPEGAGELIAYDRPDRPGPKTSEYSVYSTESPRSLLETLTSALGVRGVVRKHRDLFLVGQTRVHLDRVDGLGSFLELEVVLADGQTESEGTRIATELMAALGVDSNQWITGAYIDLLESGHAS